jgi:glycerate kinase
VDAICLGFERAMPEARLHKLPLADGGEGTAEIFIKSLGGQMVECDTTDALGRPIRAKYGWTPSMHQAVIEMSAAAGLTHIPQAERNPLRTTTFGVGTMIIDAARRGARKILVGLGGSATNDAGAGLAAALGHRFLDTDGAVVPPTPEHFPKITRIEKAIRVFTPEVVAISDVRNPLFGPTGASHIYAPQKGASPAMVELLERHLTHFTSVVQRDLHCDFSATPGAGAAGGLGYGLLSFCQATIQSGFDTFADMMELDRLIADVDLVVTGEGLLDPQTLEGKGPGGIAQRAKKAGKPVIAFAGAVRGESHLEEYFDACLPLANGPITEAESMKDARLLLVRAAERAARLLALFRTS